MGSFGNTEVHERLCTPQNYGPALGFSRIIGHARNVRRRRNVPFPKSLAEYGTRAHLGNYHPDRSGCGPAVRDVRARLTDRPSTPSTESGPAREGTNYTRRVLPFEALPHGCFNFQAILVRIGPHAPEAKEGE